MEQKQTEAQLQTERACDALVSIVVSVYNTQSYLKRCIDSILAQTHCNFELLLIDDGSTDGSDRIMDEIAGQDARIRVIHQSNTGVSEARNLGIELATGSFLSFIDSDDWVEPDFLETLLRPFDEIPGIEISICGWYWHRDGKTTLGAQQSLGLMDSKQATRAALDHSRGFHGYLWNKLFRTQLFRDHPEFRLDPDLTICEDLLLCIRIFTSGVTAYDGGEPLYHYLYRENSALRTIDESRLNEFVARERIAELCRSDETLYHAAELAQVKAALNLLVEAQDRHNRILSKAMRARIDARMGMLLRAGDLPRAERFKLIVRRIAPRLSLRIFRLIRGQGGTHGNSF